MKVRSRELLKAIFCYQKIIKKHIGYFKIKATIFYCYLFFEEYLKQDQQDGWTKIMSITNPVLRN